jgi:RNA polymerase sigma-70 factor (ECF subfamily)
LGQRFDRVWHRAALSGNPAAVEALAHAAIEPLYRFCFHRLGSNADLAEEVVQETLLRAIGELERYDPARSDGNVLPWLTGLARNAIRDTLGREKPAGRLQALWDKLDDELRSVYASLESTALADDVLQREETREMVNATMAQLPPKYREALEAKYVRGQSVRDLAAAWRVSEKAVESQLTRAREAFRRTFIALAACE